MDIKTSRKSKNISQQRLAFLSGVSRYKIHLAEQGYAQLNSNEIKRIIKTINNYKTGGA